MRPLLALSLLLAAPPPPAGGPDGAALDRIVRRALDAWEVPGCAVAVVRGDEVLYLAGHGVRDVTTRAPVTPDTVFPLGSTAKGLTVALLARLVDEGKLDWDDPVRRHLPYFRLSDPDADRQVAVRDLMCHRTGLASHNLLWYHAPWSQEEQVRRAGLLPLDRPFRSAFQYQSTMFTAAGLVAASAGQKPWADLLQEKLLGPLGLRAHLTTREALATGQAATPHGAGPDGRPEPVPRYVMDTPEPAGSLHASARETAKWLAFQAQEGRVAGRAVVSARALAETRRPHIALNLGEPERAWFDAEPAPRYGLGWVLHGHRGHPVLAHGGAIDGFRTHVAVVPGQKLGIVVFANRHQSWLPLALTLTLLDHFLDLPPRDWNAHMRRGLEGAARRSAEAERARRADWRPGERPSREAGAYAGDYEHPAYGTVKVRLERSGLVWAWNDIRSPLRHWQGDTFAVMLGGAGDAEVRFALGPGGEVPAMTVTGLLGATFRRGRGR